MPRRPNPARSTRSLSFLPAQACARPWRAGRLDDTPTRRRLLAGLATGLGAGVAAALGTAPRPVTAASDGESIDRIIHGFAPTSCVDVVSRGLALGLAQSGLGRPAVVHRKGAGGSIAVAAVRAQPATASTLLVTPGSVLTSLPHLRNIDDADEDSLRPLQPVSLLARMRLVLMVGPAVPDSVRAFHGFRQWSDWQHQPILVGNGGVGSPTHATAILLAHAAGLAVEHVPYRNDLSSARATGAGDVAASFVPIWQALPLARTGRARLLGQTGPDASRFAPDLPILAEAGLPSLARLEWLGVFMSGAVAEDRPWKLADIVAGVAAESDLRDVLLRLGLEPQTSNPDQLGRLLREDRAFWDDLLQPQAGL